MAAFPHRFNDSQLMRQNSGPEGLPAVHEEFAHGCKACVESVANTGLHYLVAVDGSASADLALMLCLMVRNKRDFVTVFHAYRDDQSGVPDKFKAATLRSRYEYDIALKVPDTHFHICWMAREGKSVSETMHNYIEFLKMKDDTKAPHFIVTGHTGRKMSKYVAPLSSNCNWFIRSLQLPVLVAKKELTSRASPKRWMMAVDGSVHSNRALDMILFLIKPKDSLELFYVYPDVMNKKEEDYTKFLKSHYENELLEEGPPNSSFTLVLQQLGVSLTHSVVNYVNDKSPDFLCLGPRASVYQHLTPMTEYVLNNADCNLVVALN